MKYKQILTEATKEMQRTMPGGKIVGNKALESTSNMREIAQKERNKRFLTNANKKLKGFKFGVGVGK